MSTKYRLRDIDRAATAIQKGAEDMAFARSKALLEQHQAWMDAAPARIREYNRPINRLRRWLVEMRHRVRCAWVMLRTGESPYHDDDW